MNENQPPMYGEGLSFFDGFRELCLNLRRGSNKAGRFVGKAGCYAVVAIADNAPFSLAVIRMAAF
mgnify:CR=1 FL=1